MDRSDGADEGRFARRQDHRGAARTRPRSAVIPARSAPDIRIPALGGAVPRVRGTHPHGGAGGQKRVLVPDLSNVIERSRLPETPQVIRALSELSGSREEDPPAFWGFQCAFSG